MEISSTQYAPGHVLEIIKSLGVHHFNESGDQIPFYCPFHNNIHTPSCSINDASGAWICFNPSCGQSGTLIELVKGVMHVNDYQAIRFIASKEKQIEDNFDELLKNAIEEKEDFIEFSKDTLVKLLQERQSSKEACDYFISRGINNESMDYFELGYSEKRKMVTVPVHSPDGIPVGIVGRSIESKKFKNSNDLPKNKTLFNIHRAKRIGGNVIIVESSFDAIRVHQSGFPNVVATLGGHISQDNINLLNRYFNRIIIMTDSDEAGRALGNAIASRLKNKEILWASHSYGKIYPHDAKDAGDMTEDEIKLCIKNSVSDFEYRNWNP